MGLDYCNLRHNDGCVSTRTTEASTEGYDMTNAGEITKQMDALEEEAALILASQTLSPFERRRMINALLTKYNMLNSYKRALSAYVMRMHKEKRAQQIDPEAVVLQIISSNEFSALRSFILSLLIWAIYEGGPRSFWVPWSFLPFVIRLRPGL